MQQNARQQILIVTVTILNALHLLGCSARQPAPPPPAPANEIALYDKTDPWILIDSKKEQLIFYKNDHPPLVFDNIAFGAAGVGEKIRRGDNITPAGIYKVGWISDKSKFHRFIGLNYPSLKNAELGLKNRIIEQKSYEKIAKAHSEGAVPPQDTALGGLIGIHGTGKGSLEIHRNINWTSGCVALENHQIEKLSRIIRPGIYVEIK